jgi:3-phosphoshikimate 1-carboxyvinyltransferase
MALPQLIEIVPLEKRMRAEITVPGSKSITNRALVLAALAHGETKLRDALWSEDTEVMVKALKKLGFSIIVEPDSNECSNRTITVKGMGGEIPKKGGTEKKPLDLKVSNAGTAARFLAALVCLGRGVYRLKGISRMHERPQEGLFNALRKPKMYERLMGFFSPSLRKLGYQIRDTNGKLPVEIHGGGRKLGAHTTVSIKESSQFASALLLCKEAGGWQIDITGDNAEESPYVAMTLNLIKAFPKNGGNFRIEPDASSGSYFWAAGWLNQVEGDLSKKTEFPRISQGELATIWEAYETKTPLPQKPVSSVLVRSWPTSGWQVDQNFPRLLRFGWDLPNIVSRARDLGDSIMTAIVLAPFAAKPCKFTELGRLRLQETERVKALKTELSRCGAEIEEIGDTLEIFPSNLRGAEIETYNDHRMAMCFAILGIKVPGIKLKNPACVKKTFPNFFQKLAAPPPKGLGVTIRDAKSGRELKHDELFAD